MRSSRSVIHGRRAACDSETTETPLRQGLLLVGHGTRSAAGTAEFRRTVGQVAALRPDWAVAGGFLELAEPTIPAAIDALAKQGVKRLIVMPLLLFAAGHARRDIPREIELAATRH